ncbi:serine/threonine protein kinase [Crinalium epipsammum PCC 9333]|uniref:non-specific serine/threonine protein kinase n=1 Tax=Crinalium epipsammum PCC 9333 TaxID=1173022 RepID=K9W3Q3_9CYAN|nr:serine/threonine-protein kinase [Crinalium epipsammum]AFZ14387.1 serine/threonine protein kinase [Crinalium epipsammum PCC 9333]
MTFLYCTQGHENPPVNKFCQECGNALPIHVGKIIDNRYRIVRCLGQGGFGRTYLAEDITQGNQNCVLKEFAPQDQPGSQLQKAQELFEREGSVLYKLQHPQIPRLREMLRSNLSGKEFLFLVQDYVEGGTYYQFLETRKRQGKTFSEDEIRELLLQILPVLSYIHSLNVIHRDISPDNLIKRQADGLPVLIDFGGVKVLQATAFAWLNYKNILPTRLGKAGYAPEEQLKQGTVAGNSDLYALAVTALVLLTGKQADELYDTYNAVWRWGEINVSPQLQAVLKKMLAYKMRDRYQSASEVIQALQSATPTPPPNPNISRIQTAVVAPGKQHSPPRSQLHNIGSQVLAAVFRVPSWLPHSAKTFAATLAIGLLVAGGFHFVKFLTEGNPLAPLTKGLPSINNNPSKLLSRRQALQIPEAFFNNLVNEQFYNKHPELNKRNLTPEPEDSQLRAEWQTIGDNFINKIEQGKVSKDALSKLGSYSQRDAEIWRQKARRGELGNYTLNKLRTATDAKFYQLFPEERRNPKKSLLLGQIWYAIAADKVSELETRN